MLNTLELAESTGYAPGALIGTAGWTIPKSVAPEFPGEAPHLERYATVMQATEINTSFYRRHRRASYERWAQCTPENFRFSVKLPREISHSRKLVDGVGLLDAFVEQIEGLGSKLAVVLVQLPPSLAFDPDTASAFFETLRARLDPAIAITTEPRHPSWFVQPVDAFLADRHIARVSADPVIVSGGEGPGGWGGLIYRRLHGSPRIYYSAYDEPRLAALAQAIVREQAAGTPSWCIFDNTASGAALADALRLQSLLK